MAWRSSRSAPTGSPTSRATARSGRRSRRNSPARPNPPASSARPWRGQGPEMAFLSLNGLDYHVQVAGSGPPLVLLHGFTGSGASWARHILAYAREFTCIAVDLPGHGLTESPADPARYAMERVVEDLAALCGQLGFERTAWLGYSMGGRLALGIGVLA